MSRNAFSSDDGEVVRHLVAAAVARRPVVVDRRRRTVDQVPPGTRRDARRVDVPPAGRRHLRPTDDERRSAL